jgi:PAS domain S-box-containing protein
MGTIRKNHRILSGRISDLPAAAKRQPDNGPSACLPTPTASGFARGTVQSAAPTQPGGTRRVTRALVWAVVLVNLFVGGIVAFTLLQGLDDARKQAEDTTQNLASVLEEDILGLVGRIDVTLLAVRDEFARQMAAGGIHGEAMTALLKRHDARLPGTLGLRVAGADGLIRYAVTGVTVQQVSIADRPQFIRTRDDPNAGLVMSEPTLGRISGQWMITLARRLDNPDGTFGGNIHVAVPLGYFSRSFSTLKLGNSGLVSLWNDTPTILARYTATSGFASQPGGVEPSAPLRHLLETKARDGTYSAKAGGDGIFRRFTCRKVGELPLFVNVGIAENDYLAEWRRQSMQRVVLALLFALSTIVAAWVSNRGWRGHLRDTAMLVGAKAEAERARRHSELILASVAEGIFGVDESGCCTFVNAAAMRMVGWAPEEFIGVHQHDAIHHTRPDGSPYPADECPACMTLRDGRVREVRDEVFWRKDGSAFPVEYVVSPLARTEGGGAVVIFRDVSERRATEREREEMLTRMAEVGRLESLGTLAGGIAHEINTPAQFISDNLAFLRDWQPRLLAVIEAARLAVQSGSLADLAERVKAFKYDFAARELPAAAEQGLEGIRRISGIVRAIKEFSYPSGKAPQPFDLNHAIELAATVTRNQWKYVAELKLDLAPELPQIKGIEGEINQILVNMIINAAQAIEEKGEGTVGHIGIASRSVGEAVEFSVADTGVGIPNENLGRLFELFFTTKAPGKGTGQGLAITQAIVVRHGGTISVQSEVGHGTCFTVRLPVAGPPASAEEPR